MSLFHCNFFAKSVGTCVNVTVLLPLTGKSGDSGAAFEEIYSVAKPYKTLYLLHECSCTVRKQATENKR